MRGAAKLGRRTTSKTQPCGANVGSFAVAESAAGFGSRCSDCIHSVLLPWGNARLAHLGAWLISAPCWRRNSATSRFLLEQATSRAVLPPAIVLGETPSAIRAFA